jgi:hypothetical protein
MSPPSFLIQGAPPPPVPQARERPQPPARAQPYRSSRLRRYRLKQMQPTIEYDASLGTIVSVSPIKGEAFNAFGATLAQELDPQEDPLQLI